MLEDATAKRDRPISRNHRVLNVARCCERLLHHAVPLCSTPFGICLPLDIGQDFADYCTRCTHCLKLLLLTL